MDVNKGEIKFTRDLFFNVCRDEEILVSDHLSPCGNFSQCCLIYLISVISLLQYQIGDYIPQSGGEGTLNRTKQARRPTLK